MTDFWPDQLTLQSPEYLWAILFVPLLWWLLRLIPPEAIRRRFPSLRLFQNLPPLRPQTAFTPLWLLILRGIMVIALIILFTEPVWQTGEADIPLTDQPVILMMDNCWAAAPNWHGIRAKALSILAPMPIAQNIAVIVACPQNADYLASHGLVNPLQARIILNRMTQQDEAMHPRKMITALRSLDLAPIAQLNFVSSGVVDQRDDMTELSRELRTYDDLRVFMPLRNQLPQRLALQEKDRKLAAIVSRLNDDAGEGSQITLRNRQNQIVSLIPFSWKDNEKIHEMELSLPPEELDHIHTISIENRGVMAAAARHRNQMPVRTGIVRTKAADNPFDDPQTYIRNALSRDTHLVMDDWNILLAQNLPVIMTTEPQLPANQIHKIENWIRRGGRLVRFASFQSRIPTDDLMPTKILRRVRSNPDYLFNNDGAQMTASTQLPALSSTFKSYFLMSPVTGGDVQIWAKFDNQAPLALARSMDKGKSIWISAPPVPESGNWATQKDFAKFIQSLLIAKEEMPAVFSPPVNWNDLAILDTGFLPDQSQLSDLNDQRTDIPFAPYITIFILLLFVVDQALIILRFSGLTWKRS